MGVEIRLGAGYKEGIGLMQDVEPLEIQIPAIHHVNRTGFRAARHRGHARHGDPALGQLVKIGGQSIMDRGARGGWPIGGSDRRQSAAPQDGTGHRRTWARHIYSIAIDLGLPVGVLTVLAAAVAWQNAQMLQCLLAKHGIAFLEPEGFNSLPHYLMERGAVICQGMPPCKLWELNPEIGRIPPQRTDTGLLPDRRGVRGERDDLRGGRRRSLIETKNPQLEAERFAECRVQ